MKSILLIVAALTLNACGFEIVDTGNRGVETRFGAVEEKSLDEGLHFYNPFTSDILEYSVRQDTWQSNTAVFTTDNQKAVISFTVTYNADPTKVPFLYKEYGREQALVEKVIKPMIIGSIQNSIGKIKADDLNMKKDQISSQLKMDLTEKMAGKFVTISDLQFVDLDFEAAYERAAEQKVVAIQEAEKAKNETVRIEEEAKQTVKTAQAEAESMRIKSQALAQNKGLVEFELAKKWDGHLPQYMFGSSIPMLNLETLKK